MSLLFDLYLESPEFSELRLLLPSSSIFVEMIFYLQFNIGIELCSDFFHLFGEDLFQINLFLAKLHYFVVIARYFCGNGGDSLFKTVDLSVKSKVV